MRLARIASVILVLLLFTTFLVDAALSSLGRNVDESSSSYLSGSKFTPGSYRSLKHVDTGTGWIYLTAYRISGGGVRLYSYEVSYTGTLNGISELYSRDITESYVDGGFSIVRVNDSTDPKLYAYVYPYLNVGVKMVTFTVTDAGVISDTIDSSYIVNIGATPNGFDAFRVSDGILCSEYTFDLGGANHYHHVRTVSVSSSGSIVGIVNSGTLGSDPSPRGRLKVFPLSGSANGSNDIEGPGWWGSVCRKTTGAWSSWLSTYNVSSTGTITINTGEVSFPGIKCTSAQPGPLVRVSGSSDLYLFSYNDTSDTGWLGTFRISEVGVVTTSPIHTYNWEPSPTDEVSTPSVLHIAGDRYAVVYYAGSGKGIRTAVFSVGDDGDLAGSLVGDEQITSDDTYNELWSFHKTSSDAYGTTWLMEYPYSSGDVRLRTFEYYTPPVITNTSYSTVRDTSAKGGGYLADCGYDCPTIVGVAWSSTDTSPSTSGSYSSTGGSYPVGSSWLEDIEGLTADTVYYIRPFATNEIGTGYGPSTNFLTTKVWTNKQVDLDFSASSITKGSLVVEDLTGNGNDATIELAPMDSDITLSIGSLAQNTSYLPQAGADYELEGMWDPISQPDSMYQEGRGQGLPAYELIEEASEGMGWSTNRTYSFLMVVTAIGMGLGAVIATGSPLMGSIACGVIMVAGVGTGVLPFWIVLTYALLASAYLVASRSM